MPLFGSGQNNQQPDIEAPPDHIPYAERLAFIGRQVDGSSCRRVVITEISGNFIVRTTDARSGALQLSEVVEEDFGNKGAGLRFGRPGVDSYEVMLGMLGRDLDALVAANVAIIERQGQFQVVGWIHGEAAGRPSYVRFDQTYPFAELQRAAGSQG